MALSTNSNVWKILLVIFILISLVFVVFFYFSTIFLAVIVAVILIVMTEKLKRDFKKRITKYNLSKTSKKILAAVLILFWFFTISFMVYSSVGDLKNSIDQVSADDQTMADIYHDKVEPYLPAIVNEQIITEQNIKTAQSYVLKQFSGIFSKLSTFMFAAVLIIPLMFYMFFRRKDELLAKLLKAVPRKFKKGFIRAADGISDQLSNFLEAKVLQSVIIAAICALGFFVSGVKGWLILAIVAGFLNIVPYIGPIIGAIPPIVITLLTDNPIVVLFVIITVVIAQLVDAFYLTPFLISSRVKMDALLSIILFLIGAQLFGVMGMVFAIPIFIVYKIVIQESYQELVKIYK